MQLCWKPSKGTKILQCTCTHVQLRGNWAIQAQHTTHCYCRGCKLHSPCGSSCPTFLLQQPPALKAT
jgi:hypothetical protein